MTELKVRNGSKVDISAIGFLNFRCQRLGDEVA